MKDYFCLYSVRAKRVVQDEEIFSHGAPFVAVDDDAAICAVRDSIADQIKSGVLDRDLLKNHTIVNLGRFYFAKRQPIALRKPKPHKVFDCSNFIDDSVQKEDSDTDAEKNI